MMNTPCVHMMNTSLGRPSCGPGCGPDASAPTPPRTSSRWSRARAHGVPTARASCSGDTRTHRQCFLRVYGSNPLGPLGVQHRLFDRPRGQVAHPGPAACAGRAVFAIDPTISSVAVATDETYAPRRPRQIGKQLGACRIGWPRLRQKHGKEALDADQPRTGVAVADERPRLLNDGQVGGCDAGAQGDLIRSLRGMAR